MTPSLEIALAHPGDADAFWRMHERARRSEQWGFKVVWHEQSHDVTASLEGAVVGALRIRIAASLAHVEGMYVLEPHRRAGIGRALLARGEDVANYYNCHKVSAGVLNGGAALTFFVACGYHVEAVLPQHTFKLDVSVLRKFLL